MKMNLLFKIFFTESSRFPGSPEHSWAMTQVKEKDARSDTKKQHPSFETWVMPSPHDSEDYDTDLETDMLKSESYFRVVRHCQFQFL